MADINSTALQLSADELRSLTKWPDSVIIEFLSLTGAVSDITNNINIVINNVDSVMTMEAQNLPMIQALRNAQASIQQQVDSLNAIPAKVAGIRRDLSNALHDQAEAISGWEALVAALKAKISAQDIVIDNLIQQVSVVDPGLLARITRERDARLDLEQLHYS